MEDRKFTLEGTDYEVKVGLKGQNEITVVP